MDDPIRRLDVRTQRPAAVGELPGALRSGTPRNRGKAVPANPPSLGTRALVDNGILVVAEPGQGSPVSERAVQDSPDRNGPVGSSSDGWSGWWGGAGAEVTTGTGTRPPPRRGSLPTRPKQHPAWPGRRPGCGSSACPPR